MTGRPTEDELRAMLESRADALPPGAAREVLAAARAEIAGPVARDGSGVAFVPRPVAVVRRRTRMPWGIAAAAAAVVLAVAVLGGRVALEQPRATTPVAGASTPPLASNAVPTVPGDTPLSSPQVAAFGPVLLGTAITAEELGNQLRTGELDGKTVIVRGAVTLLPGHCRSTQDCVFLQVEALPGVGIDKGDRTPDEAQAEIDFYGPTAPVVLQGSGGGLRLLGWLVAGSSEPLAPDGQRLIPQSYPADGLIAMNGWLQGAGNEVRLSETPDARGVGITVAVDPRMPPAAFEPARGTFLVRDLQQQVFADPRWEVVGRADPATTVVVDAPATNVAGRTISASDLMAAIKDGSLDGQIFAIDGALQTVAAECPLDAPEPCMRFYVDGLPGVAITWDGALLGSDGSPGEPVSGYLGRLLVTPRHGRLQPGTGWLELLGVLHGDLDHPIAVGDLEPSADGGSRDPLQLDAVDGWFVDDGPIFCAFIPAGGTPCPQHSVLSDQSPDAVSGTHTAHVVQAALHQGAPGVGEPPISEAGPFLVRLEPTGKTCNDGGAASKDCLPRPGYGWVVAGRYDPGQVRVVTFP